MKSDGYLVENIHYCKMSNEHVIAAKGFPFDKTMG